MIASRLATVGSSGSLRVGTVIVSPSALAGELNGGSPVDPAAGSLKSPRNLNGVGNGIGGPGHCNCGIKRGGCRPLGPTPKVGGVSVRLGMKNSGTTIVVTSNSFSLVRSPTSPSILQAIGALELAHARFRGGPKMPSTFNGVPRRIWKFSASWRARISGPAAPLDRILPMFSSRRRHASMSRRPRACYAGRDDLSFAAISRDMRGRRPS